MIQPMSAKSKIILRDLKTSPESGGHRLYYFQGNFYHPLVLWGNDKGRVAKAIRMFKINNRALVENDRAHPDYKTLPEIFDAQM